ncbi:hypothetical protein RhiJN_19966 [Ceratobasidium sp. AG-Ba]|nr:hypothetical protein RhiJN_19966 [Ceratobasidium sp. AG-Ba]
MATDMQANDLIVISDTSDSGTDSTHMEHMRGFKDFYPALAPLSEEMQDLPKILRSMAETSSLTMMLSRADCDTKRICQSVLHATAHILGLATDSAIYVIAMWDSGSHGTEVYETTSSRISPLLRHGRFDVPRLAFLKVVHDELEWQHIPTPLPWTELDDDIRNRRYQYVSPQRLPPGHTRMDHPVNWSEDEVRRTMAFFRRCQAWLEQGATEHFDRIFQWRQSDVHDQTVLTPHEDSSLEYPEASCNYYLANEIFKYREDYYLSEPTLFRLISRDCVENFVNRNDTTEASHFAEGSAELQAIVQFIPMYEQYSPPQRTRQEHDPLILQFYEVKRVPIDDLTCRTLLPAPFYELFHEDRSNWQLSELVRWMVKEDRMADTATGVLNPVDLQMAERNPSQ